MFIELQQPKIVDVQEMKDRVKIRIREHNAPGRIWLNLSYFTMDEAKAAIRDIMEALERGGQEYTGPPDVRALPGQ